MSRCIFARRLRSFVLLLHEGHTLRFWPVALVLAAFLVVSPNRAHAQFVCDSVVPGGADGAVAAGSGVACGTNADASGAAGRNTAFGNGANASGDVGANTATGFQTSATGDNGFNTASGAFANAGGVSSGNTASGALASATGGSSFNTASGFEATARGDGSTNTANGARSFADGQGSFNTASGARANAGGDGTRNTAVGADSTATGINSSAFGGQASATHDNSAAFGTGASTTRDNQQVFGTTNNTYTAPGITSAASAAAQGAPTHVVTSNASGDLAAYTFSELGLASQGDIDAVNSRVDKAFDEIDENTEGVAMAIAMAGAFLPQPGETIRFSGNWGNFEGSNAVAFNGAGRLSGNTYFSVGIGAGLEEGTVGGRAGLSFGW